MKHNIIPKALRCLAAAGLCLAAAACSKDDITPEPAPQQGITPTKIIFNVTRGGYDGDAETRAPKSEWAEGDVVYFGRYNDYFKNKAIYTDGEWVVNMKVPITENTASLRAIYGEHIRQNEDINNTSWFYVDAMGDIAYTKSGSYEMNEGGVATITLNLDQHPQGRMTFTGVGKGKELTVLNMKSIKMISNLSFEFRDPAPITLTGEDDGTTTLYALPDPTTVTDAGITLTAQYEGKLYTKTFAGKEFKENSNITLAVPSTEGGWTDATTIPVMGVTLNKTALTLNIGASATLTATVAPADATNKKVTWKSSDAAVASVDANGKVTGVKAGEATITVTTEDGGKTATCKVTVKPNLVSEITLAALDIYVGESKAITATVKPDDATNKALTWKSSDETVATVDATGKVTGKKIGTATITATAQDGSGVSGSCTVTVLSDVKTVTVEPANLTLGQNKSYTLKATVEVFGSGTDTGVTWTSSDTTIATVDATGKVTATDKVGTVTITATSKADPAKKGTCTVKVSGDQTDIGYGEYGPEENW